MIKLNLIILERIKAICKEADVEDFTLKVEVQTAIGNILTLTYDTFVGDYPAKMVVEVSKVEDW